MAASFLLIEEYFATGDDRFVETVREFNIPGSLATITDRWKLDPRPWARQQILRYLDLPLNCPGHETVVKRLYKQAEANKDDGLMAAFAVAFDRLVRRKRKKSFRYDYKTRQSWHEEVLICPRDKFPTPSQGSKQGPVAASFKPARPGRRGKMLFSYHTRYYLRRRVWRYFRRMAFARPAQYPAAIAAMLRLYRDEDLAQGENILDSWSLSHACFGESDILDFGAAKVSVRKGRALRELKAAPARPKLWETPLAGAALVELLIDANSRLVRVWAMELLRKLHSTLLKTIPVTDIRRLLDHPDPDVQAMGAQLLEESSELDKLPVAEWLVLLTVRSPIVLETICRLMAQHVHADRLDLKQTVELARAKPTPVARLGFAFLRERQIVTEADRQIIGDLADARCATIASQLAAWALSRLGDDAAYNVDRIARFFDSLLIETRRAAWDWLTPTTRGWNDPSLWSRLVETPYDDVRLRFVTALQQRAQMPGVGVEHLSGVWTAVLLGIHRGGRHKLIALRQISDAVREHPEAAEQLLPVLAVAIRSVRPPEARAGLAAIVGAVEARPELAELVAKVLPELQLVPAEVKS